MFKELHHRKYYENCFCPGRFSSLRIIRFISVNKRISLIRILILHLSNPCFSKNLEAYLNLVFYKKTHLAFSSDNPT